MEVYKNKLIELGVYPVLLEGDIPNPAKPPAGCRFHTRCPVVEERCRREEPQMEDRGDGHVVACHLVE